MTISRVNNWHQVKTLNLLPNEVYNDADHEAPLRDVRFKMSLRTKMSFHEWLRMRLNCPFGIRIQIKKGSLAQGRKLKKWFRRLKRGVNRKRQNDGLLKNNLSEVQCAAGISKNPRPCTTISEIEWNFNDSDSSSRTVVYSPAGIILDIPLVSSICSKKGRNALPYA